MVYSEVETVSWAVDRTEIVLFPTSKLTELETPVKPTVTLLTWTLAVESKTIAVTCKEEGTLGTDIKYSNVCGSNDGDRGTAEEVEREERMDTDAERVNGVSGVSVTTIQ